MYFIKSPNHIRSISNILLNFRFVELKKRIIVRRVAFCLKSHKHISKIFNIFWKFLDYFLFFTSIFCEAMVKSSINLLPCRFATICICTPHHQIRTSTSEAMEERIVSCTNPASEIRLSRLSISRDNQVFGGFQKIKRLQSCVFLVLILQYTTLSETHLLQFQLFSGANGEGPRMLFGHPNALFGHQK